MRRIVLLTLLSLSALSVAGCKDITVIVDSDVFDPGPTFPAFADDLEVSLNDVLVDIHTNHLLDLPVNPDIKGYQLPVYANEYALTFYWESYYWDEGGTPNRSYWIALMQELPEGGFIARKVTHYIVDPVWELTYFEMDAIGWYDDVCFGCVSFVLILPETYELTFNPDTNSYEYVFTPILHDVPGKGADDYELDRFENYVQFSKLFTLQDTRPQD